MSDVVSDAPPPSEIPSEEKQWAMFAHLSALLAGFLGPLIIWLIQKDKMKFVDDQGKEALNFQINLVLLLAATGVLGTVLTFVTFGLGAFLLIPIGLGISAAAIVFPILAAVKVNAGEAYRYPYIVRLVK